MKVLILGAEGFVGRHVKQQLLANHKIISAIRDENASGNDYFVDLESKESIVDSLIKTHPEVIINCAGIVENSERARLNVVFSTNLMEAVHQSGIKKPEKIIISGSAAEYGVVSPGNIPVNENVSLNANAGYGLSKVQEETTCLRLGDKYGLKVVVARIFNPIGAGMHSRFLIPKIIEQIREIEQGTRLAIEVNRLDSRRDYVSVKDIGLAIKTLVENNPKESVYNIGSGKSTSNGELVKLLIDFSKLKDKPPVTESSKQEEPLVAIEADISRIKDEFGWIPSYTIEDTLKEIIDATKQ